MLQGECFHYTFISYYSPQNKHHTNHLHLKYDFWSFFLFFLSSLKNKPPKTKNPKNPTKYKTTLNWIFSSWIKAQP